MTEVDYWGELYKIVMEGCDRTGIDPDRMIMAAFHQVSNWIIWGAWHVGGAMIFSLHPELAQEFLETDVEGLKIKDIKMPANELYLHWGFNESLGGIDGCYVFNIDGGLFFSPTFFDPNKDYEKPVNWFYELQTPLDYKLEGEWDISYELIHKKITKTIEQFQDVEAFMHVGPGGAAVITEFMSEAYCEFQKYLLPIIRLIVTALLYLTSAPDDVTPEWKDAPEDLVQKWEEAPKAKRKRITQELNKLGYRRIRFVGRKLTYPDAPTRPPRQPIDTSHLVFNRRRRRGHIRHQACGEGRQQRKIVFIRPTWTWVKVNEANADMDLPRVYDVAPQ
jgi:hypothetical protein